MKTIVYISCAESGDIAVLQLQADSGSLTPLQRAMVGGKAGPLAIDPGRRLMFAARRSDPFAALAFAIDPAVGTLSPLGEQALPHSMAYIATDRSGRFLLSASYGGNLLAVNPIGVDGLVMPTQQVLNTEPHAHAVLTDPANRFLFATSLGGGHVLQRRFDAATGRLVPNDPPMVRVHAGAGPRHLRFHPNGRWLYLINELDASLVVFDFDMDSGTLAAVQTLSSLVPGFAGQAWAAELQLTPDGRFLYSSERRSSTLTSFAVDPGNGHLTLLGHTPTEQQPRGFNIDPQGRWLLAVGELSNRLSGYSIDARSGRLDKVMECNVGQGPHWVEIVELP